MSVVCRNTEDGVIRLLCKGADSVIMERMKEGMHSSHSLMQLFNSTHFVINLLLLQGNRSWPWQLWLIWKSMPMMD